MHGLRLEPLGLGCCGRERELITDMTGMSTLSAGEVLQAKYARFTQKQTHSDVSIENTENNVSNNTSIELPAEITVLITGSDFWVRAKTHRYKKLIREGHLDKLLHLAREAQTKEHPANWFAAACSKARWEQCTLPYFAKLHDVARKAESVARRLGTQINRFIYKQIWKGVNVERWAIAAEEVRHAKPGQSRVKYFAWLCAHEQRLAATA
jgi:hypothetical protein